MQPWQKIAVIGVGLLGGSLGLAVKKRRLADRVDAYVRRSASVQECHAMGAADTVGQDLGAAVKGADLVILCTPVSQMRRLTEQMLPNLKAGTVVTDVGSVKALVVQELEALVSSVGACFVGSHPMAGAEKAGVLESRPDLFEGAVCVLTPTPNTASWALARVEEFWKHLGCRLVKVSPELHDDLAGRASHLPHVVAAELANYVLSPAHPKEQALLCANGFRDTTRIASGPPEMWRDIVLANRRHLGRVLGVVIEDLQEFQLALENEDRESIQEFFEQAQQRRDQWCAQNHSPE